MGRIGMAGTSGGGGMSLLASQLAEPPLQSSLLASTLSQGLSGSLASEEQSKRNEILAQLILDGNRNTPSSTTCSHFTEKFLLPTTTSRSLNVCLGRSSSTTTAAPKVNTFWSSAA